VLCFLRITLSADVRADLNSNRYKKQLSQPKEGQPFRAGSSRKSFIFRLVRRRGLEPLCLAALTPQASGASLLKTQQLQRVRAALEPSWARRVDRPPQACVREQGGRTGVVILLLLGSRKDYSQAGELHKNLHTSFATKHKLFVFRVKSADTADLKSAVFA
jgi:hypothetical protein